MTYAGACTRELSREEAQFVIARGKYLTGINCIKKIINTMCDS